MITRIAPSPTGHFHLGTARTAYFNWLMAKANGGKFFLRIDDTDAARNNNEHIDTIISAMKWLGLDYDFIEIQSERFNVYHAIADALIFNNLAVVDQEGVTRFTPKYIPSEWQDEIAGTMKISKEDKRITTNMVLLRSDGSPTYHFASVVDDIFLRVTDIIRGVDHINNTARQVALMHAITSIEIGGFKPTKIRFHHVGLIHSDGKKLSKRDNASNLLDYKDEYLPEAILNFLLKMGWNLPDPNIDQKMPLINKNDAIKLFLDGRMRSAPSNFNHAKLAWYNKQYKKLKYV